MSVVERCAEFVGIQSQRGKVTGNGIALGRQAYEILDSVHLVGDRRVARSECRVQVDTFSGRSRRPFQDADLMTTSLEVRVDDGCAPPAAVRGLDGRIHASLSDDLRRHPQT
jgi:hypothetical protein